MPLLTRLARCCRHPLAGPCQVSFPFAEEQVEGTAVKTFVFLCQGPMDNRGEDGEVLKTNQKEAYMSTRVDQFVRA